MKGVNTKLNYNQSVTECRDKLVDLRNKWEMDDSDKETMTFEVDNYFMSTIYSVLKILNKPDMREKIKEYISELDVEIDRLDKILEDMITEPEKETVDQRQKDKTIENIKSRVNTLMDVKCDLESRLEELV